MTWTAESLLCQIELGEDSRLEFKEAFFRNGRVSAPGREVVANELAAFGNSSGGALVFSVSDGGEVRPLTRAQIDALETFVGEICSNSIKPSLHFTTQRLALSESLAVLVVEIESSPLVHRGPGGYMVVLARALWPTRFRWMRCERARRQEMRLWRRSSGGPGSGTLTARGTASTSWSCAERVSPSSTNGLVNSPARIQSTNWLTEPNSG